MEGWRAGVLSCSLVAFSVLIINFTLKIWATVTCRVESGFGLLYNGSCSKAREINSVLHILINVLSTVRYSRVQEITQCSASTLPLERRLIGPTQRESGLI
jgi:hypothetical protein